MLSSNTSAANGAANYIEDVFSTYLYTGNGSTQTITNGIDLAGKGGLVWLKGRTNNSGTLIPFWVDSARGNFWLSSSSTGAQTAMTTATQVTLNNNGFTLGSAGNNNSSLDSYASWTFRKQPKFFDVVTYTGTGVARTVAHSLGSTPGFIIVKRTDTTGAWTCYHTSIGNTKFLPLNATNAAITNAAVWNNTAPTSTVFTVGTDTDVNASGGTYVAYILAHDAGGFGLTGTDNVISCGSFTTDGSGNVTVNLGYEPQWIMYKRTDSTGFWVMVDSMRGIPTGSNDPSLFANSSDAEATSANRADLSATGFYHNGGTLGANASYIYIAIRRGPMKVPTTGTSVFSPNISSSATGTAITTNFPVDMQIGKYRAGAAANAVVDRLRGVSTTSTEVGSALTTTSTAAEGTASGADSRAWDNTGFQMPANLGGISDIFWNFRRAPSFFDEVCYTGDDDYSRTLTHNLASQPELLIFKKRNGAQNWTVAVSNGLGSYNFLRLNLDLATYATRTSANVATTSVINIGNISLNVTDLNTSGLTFVAYLFASCPGVSKVGSYSGTGAAQTINCGFTGGARFVLIKRTDSTGDWYVFDSARGIVAAADPYFKLNTAEAEVTTIDVVDTASSGFIVNQEANTNLNVNAATYIFLAIA